jgi:hypothetical protein
VGRRRPKVKRAGDVSCAVKVVTSRVKEKERLCRNGSRRVSTRSVVNNCSVRPHASDRLKREGKEPILFGSHGVENSADTKLCKRLRNFVPGANVNASKYCDFEPRKKRRQSDSIPKVGGS